jgi:hypothetical protein
MKRIIKRNDIIPVTAFQNHPGGFSPNLLVRFPLRLPLSGHFIFYLAKFK